MDGAEGEGVEVEVEEVAGKVFGEMECGWEIMAKEKKARERPKVVAEIGRRVDGEVRTKEGQVVIESD